MSLLPTLQQAAASPATNQAALPTGADAGGYRIIARLAAGGCGAVYRAEHRILGRDVAIKVLHRELLTSPTMRQRFVREARVMSRLRHPNVVDVYEFGELPDGRPFYVMELLDGITLERAIEAHGRYAPREVLAIIAPVCAALHVAHRHGLVHRDLKSANVFVAAPGEQIKVIDFGIAKCPRDTDGCSDISAVDERLGTPHAMAPEQILGGPVDARTDVYALGVLTFELLTGALPFKSLDRKELLRQHLEAPPPSAAALTPLPRALDALVTRALQKDAQLRPPSARAFAHELARAIGAGRSTVTSARGVVLYAHCEPTDVAAIEDAALDEVGHRVELAVERVTRAGFAVVCQTATTLLAVRLSSDQEQQRAMLAAREVWRLLYDSVPGWRATVALHAGELTVDGNADGPAALGGALLRPTGWLPIQRGRLLASDAFLGECDGRDDLLAFERFSAERLPRSA